MRDLFLFIICFLIAMSSYAGDTDSLVSYLATHQSVINRKPDGEPELSAAANAIISRHMKGKRLFVLGEGGSHFLKLNAELRILLEEYFITHGLKNIFVEGDRSLAYLDNLYLKGAYLFTDSSYKKHVAFLERERAALADGQEAELCGIDFERPWNFHAAMAEIVQHINKEDIDTLFSLAPYTRDSDYVKFSAKEWQKYYKSIGIRFYKDSLKLRGLLGSQYAQFKYLVTNPNIASPSEERNHPMAGNLLGELAGKDGQVTYLLDCGAAHSRPNKNGTLVNILEKSDELRGQICVMNVICEDCMTSVEKVSNWAFPYMRGEILAAFSKAAQGDVVLYDLSDLPDRYKYIRDYGALLVFAKQQQ